jgi:hypothetical protein
MKAILRGLLLGAAPLMFVAAAMASDGPPVLLHLTDLDGPAVAGETITATLVVRARADLGVATLTSEGAGWRDVRIEAPAVFILEPGEEQHLTLRAVAVDPTLPLVIRIEAGGRAYQRAFDLSPQGHEIAHHGHEIVAAETAMPPTLDPATLLAPAPADPLFSKRPLDVGSAEDEVAGDPVRAERSGYSIRVTGQMAYYYPADATHPVEENPAHGLTVRVYDQDSGPDDLLAATTTSASGYFEVTFTWDPCALCDGTPDLYVQFETANICVDVEESGIWEHNYKFNTATFHDYTGTELNLGGMTPADPALYGGLHILKTLTRGWLILYEEAGFYVPHVDAQWPDDGWQSSYYDGSEIHYTTNSQWSENTIFHEWGHHWVHSFAVSPPAEYCNPGGYCDEPECTHCAWCEENENVAFTEGVPEWWAGYLIDRVGVLYDPDPRWGPDLERFSLCGESGAAGDPYITEGYFCNLLNDFEDATDEDHNISVYGKDVVNLGFAGVLNFIDTYHPTTPRAFLDQMVAISPPHVREQIWQTAANIGYTHLDTEPPPAPIDVISLSHTVGVPSVDHTLHMAWTHPVDDVSGVWGYAYVISMDAPMAPSGLPMIQDADYFISDYLPDGNWYFNIRTIDHDWHGSDDYVSVGPLVIDSGGECNLAYWASFDWERPLIPRPAPDVVWGGPFVGDPETLYGGVPSTYLNAYSGNFGGESTQNAFWDYFWVDEDLVWWINWVEQPPWETMAALNCGPITVPSGRHTLHAMLDSEETVGELWETDNVEGHQWIWSPFVIVPGSPVLCAAPPDMYAGHTSVTDGQTLWPNSDGFRFTQTGWWQAAYAVQYEPESDYDLRLHQPSTGPSDGFAELVAGSAQSAGYLDAVVVNGNQVAWQTWDVGVTNYNTHDGLYSMVTEISQGIEFDTPETFTLEQFEMLALREFLGEPGLYTIEVEIDRPYRPVHVGCFDAAFTIGGLVSVTGIAETDSTGRAWLEVDLPSNGWHGIVVYRDQKDSVEQVQVTLEVYPTRAELYPVTLDGWYSPLVPRPTDDAWPDVPMPPYLVGETDQTWFNVAVTNDSPVMAEDVVTYVYLDGDDIRPVGIGYPGFTGDFPVTNILSAVPISGGRHSLCMWVDCYEAVPERMELNNIYGEQWVWSPGQAVDVLPIVRPAPAWRMGGMDGMTVMETYFYNCDGLRTPVLTPGVPTPDDGWWCAVAMQAESETNYDLRLFETATSAKDGFDSFVARSAWLDELPELVLVNLAATADRQFDVGVVNYGGYRDYMIHTDLSVYGGATVPGLYGPYPLYEWDLVNLHEFDLPAGQLLFTLRDLAGGVDWGVSLYPRDQPYLGKSDVLDGALAFMNGVGIDESFSCRTTEAGRYLLAVWRATGLALDNPGEYEIEINFDPSAAPDAPLPSRCTLAQNAPNPGGPGTSIRFELDHETAVDLRVFDPAGRVVRVLRRDPAAVAGVHEVVWDGADALGREAPAGVYFYRLETDTFSETKRLILVR